MQDRLCGRCDCVLRASKYSDGSRWYKEPPSRCQGWPTRIHFKERGQGNPEADIWVLSLANNLPDRETELSKQLREILEETDFPHLHEKNYGGVTGLHPQIVTGGPQAEFWKNLLGVDEHGSPREKRGFLWEQWLGGNLFVTQAIKCYTSGDVPEKNADLFATQCQIHLKEQFDTRQPKVLIVVGKVPGKKFFEIFLPGEKVKYGAEMELATLGGLKTHYLPDPADRRGPKALEKLEKSLRKHFAEAP